MSRVPLRVPERCDMVLERWPKGLNTGVLLWGVGFTRGL